LNLSSSELNPVGHLAVLINNSFYENVAEIQGGALRSGLTKPFIFNTTFTGDDAPSGKEIFLTHAFDTVDLAYCNIDLALIHGNVSDEGGNTNCEPVFLDDSCHIDQYCSIEDHGADSIFNDGTWYYAPPTDFEGTPRPYHMGVDIGADECDIIDKLPDPGHESLPPVLVQPNPFNDHATLSYEIEEFGRVSLAIYNDQGQMVEQLVNDLQVQGTYSLHWSAKGLAAGVYFYRLTLGDKSAAGKIILNR